MLKEPIELTLYDENSEPIKIYKRAVIPWGVLKQALSFKSINTESSDCIDKIARFVCDFFNGTESTEKSGLLKRIFGKKNKNLTVEMLEKGADVTEMMSVIQAIITRANDFNPNV
jgi:hypothetical protein